MGTDNFKGYYVGLNAEADVVVFGRFENKWLPAVSQGKALEPNRLYHVRVEARGPQFRVWVEDMEAPIIEARDETFTSGNLGMRSYSNRAGFAKLSARAL